MSAECGACEVCEEVQGHARNELGVSGLVVESLEVREGVLVHKELEDNRAAAGQLLAAGHDAGVARYPGRVHIILVCAALSLWSLGGIKFTIQAGMLAHQSIVS